MKILILSLLISVQLRASQDCIPGPHHEEGIQEIAHLLETLDSDIENAPCKAKEPPSQDEVNRLISQRRNSKASENVHGVNFVDEDPALIKSFKEMTTAMDIYSINPEPDRQIEIQNQYGINPECTKVDCAVKKIWGEEIGPKLLFMKLKHGFNGSEFVYKNTERFDQSELDDVLMGLEDMPSSWVPIADNKRMTRFKRGSTLAIYANRSVAANATITVFDIWSDLSKRRRQETIFHEVSHNMAYNLGSLDEKPEWLNLTGWIKKEDKWTSDPAKCQVTEYGTTNPAEDWAETLMVYRYKASELKKKCPEKYAFVKKHAFKDIEYLTPESCSEILPTKLSGIKGKLKNLLLTTSQTSNLNDDDINNLCSGFITDVPIPSKELQKCHASLNLNNISQATIDQLMTEEGIEINSKNRNIIFSSLQKNLSEDQSYISATKSSTSELSKKLQAMTSAAIEKSLPSGIGGLTDSHIYWWYAEKKCGELYFKGNIENIRKCITTNMVLEDNKTNEWKEGIFPKFVPPKFLKETAASKALEQRDRKLQEHLNKDETFKILQDNRVKNFKTSLQLQAYRAMKAIPNLPKDLPPKEFCLQTYGGAASYLVLYGFNEGEPLPEIQKWCEQIQATKPERFEIPSSTWNEKVDSIFPK